MRRIGIIGAASTALVTGSMTAIGAPLIEPRRVEVPEPKLSRKERIRRGRGRQSRAKPRPAHTPLAYVVHAALPNGDPACMKRRAFMRNHRIKPTEKPTCNDCQRALWRAEQEKRGR